MTSTTSTTSTPARETVKAYLGAIEAGASIPPPVLADDVRFDATVPGWRFVVEGVDAVTEELGKWYADPGHFLGVEELWVGSDNADVVVTFGLEWTEGGSPMRCHQSHRLHLDGGRIATITALCGGRWSKEEVDAMIGAGTITDDGFGA